MSADNKREQNFPKNLTEGVPQHPETGEYFWPHEKVWAAIELLSSRGLAVVSAELSSMEGSTLAPGRALGRDGKQLLVAFDADDRPAAGSWADYVARCKEQILHQIEDFNAPSKVATGKTSVLYCLTYVEEDE